MNTEKKISFNDFPVAGIRMGVACAGIKKPQHRDLVVFELVEGATTAAVFTQNAFCAAPVIISKEHIATTAPRYLLVNTGNANAGTGKQGLEDARNCCALVAEATGCKPEEVLPFSTGVIGEYLPMEKFKPAIQHAIANLAEDNWEDAAHGILTTDTVIKAFTRKLELQGKVVVISGIAKGSGMIRPDMATMLAYIATDAAIEQNLLQQCLQQAVNVSFNRITVDGDTSTNDSAILMATGKSGIEISADSAELAQFQQALSELCVDLAKDMVRDGEGATKLITIKVNGCNSENEASEVAYTVAHSPLVKTAFFASDPNWGRILAAVGRANIPRLDLEKVNIALDDVFIVRNGEKAEDYTEERGQKVMDQVEISVHIDLGRGNDSTTVWTCDFSYDYVRINAEYRT